MLNFFTIQLKFCWLQSRYCNSPTKIPHAYNTRKQNMKAYWPPRTTHHRQFSIRSQSLATHESTSTRTQQQNPESMTLLVTEDDRHIVKTSKSTRTSFKRLRTVPQWKHQSQTDTWLMHSLGQCKVRNCCTTRNQDVSPLWRFAPRTFRP